MSVSKLILYGKNLVFKKTDSNKLLLSNNINPTFTTNIYDQLAHVWELNEKSGTIALDSYGRWFILF